MKRSLILFGDSLFGRCSKFCTEAIEKQLPEYLVYNCATGGFNSQDALEHAKFISQLEPDVIVFSLGTNDVAPWKETLTLDEFKDNFKSIIKLFPNSQKLILPFPLAYEESNNPLDVKSLNTLIKPFNKAIYDFSDILNVTILNVEDLNYKKGFRLEDGIHLSKQGFDLVITKIVKSIK